VYLGDLRIVLPEYAGCGVANQFQEIVEIATVQGRIEKCRAYCKGALSIRFKQIRRCFELPADSFLGGYGRFRRVGVHLA